VSLSFLSLSCFILLCLCLSCLCLCLVLSCYVFVFLVFVLFYLVVSCVKCRIAPLFFISDVSCIFDWVILILFGSLFCCPHPNPTPIPTPNPNNPNLNLNINPITRHNGGVRTPGIHHSKVLRDAVCTRWTSSVSPTTIQNKARPSQDKTAATHGKKNVTSAIYCTCKQTQDRPLV
jgi:hypothetical protein